MTYDYFRSMDSHGFGCRGTVRSGLRREIWQQVAPFAEGFDDAGRLPAELDLCKSSFGNLQSKSESSDMRLVNLWKSNLAVFGTLWGSCSGDCLCSEINSIGYG
jgi:hypothetical protein